MANPGLSASHHLKSAHAELDKLQKQDFWLKVQRAKLIMDLIFVCQSVSSSCSETRANSPFFQQPMIYSNSNMPQTL